VLEARVFLPYFEVFTIIDFNCSTKLECEKEALVMLVFGSYRLFLFTCAAYTSKIIY